MTHLIMDAIKKLEDAPKEMWELSKQFTFEAAHHLPDHDGKCRRVHGHSWKGRVVVSGESLHTTGPKSGMLMDYSDLKAGIEPIVEKYLDHYDLNETLGLPNPTSEEIAKWIFLKLCNLPWSKYIKYIQIDETCTSSCRYYPPASPFEAIKPKYKDSSVHE